LAASRSGTCPAASSRRASKTRNDRWRRAVTRDVVRSLLLIAWAAGPQPGPGAPPPPAGDSEYVFVPNTDRYVTIERGDIELLGKLDSDGYFLESARFSRHGFASAGTKPSVLINGNPGPAYEYRSGRLIKGVIRADGNFVPDIGSKVILFKDYR